MNTNAFFHTHFIHWTAFFRTENFLIALFLTLVLYFLYKKFWKKTFKKEEKFEQKKYTKKKNIPIHWPKKNENNFEKKLFIALQQKIMQQYFPQNSEAHTQKDIKKYCKDGKLLEILAILENAIFEKKTLSEHEKSYLLQYIHTIFCHKC